MPASEDIGLFKDKLAAYESPAPSFDALFTSEELEEVRLCLVCRARLKDYEVKETPSWPFVESRDIPVRRKQRAIPIPFSYIAVAAVACLAFLLLFLNPVSLQEEPIGLVNTPESQRAVHTVPRNIRPAKAETFQPSRITLSKITPEKHSIISEKAVIRVSNMVNKDSLHADSMFHAINQKIAPRSYRVTGSAYSISVEEAYARARLRKRQKNRENKWLAGINLQGANRLLSFVNTRAGDNPLQAINAQYKTGLSTLDATSSSLLRSVAVSKNEWEPPANIPSASLAAYKAVHSMPINGGLSLSIPLTYRVEIQTGIGYTYLSSRTTGLVNTASFELNRSLHYVGVPLKLAFQWYEAGGFHFYGAVGGVVEKGLIGKQFSVVTSQDGQVSTWEASQRIEGLQPMLTGLLGISYDMPRQWQFYIEPGALYSFDTDQPVSSRTEEPFCFNIGLGLRYRVK